MAGTIVESTKTNHGEITLDLSAAAGPAAGERQEGDQGSSLAGLRPFSLPMFHPAHALGVLFVVIRCLLRYWLGFYLS